MFERYGRACRDLWTFPPVKIYAKKISNYILILCFISLFMFVGKTRNLCCIVYFLELIKYLFGFYFEINLRLFVDLCSLKMKELYIFMSHLFYFSGFFMSTVRTKLCFSFQGAHTMWEIWKGKKYNRTSPLLLKYIIMFSG
jgi:hypothetical protein